ncbi:MAG: C25 family cysteine peptidase [Pseudomonadales bacterium]
MKFKISAFCSTAIFLISLPAHSLITDVAPDPDWSEVSGNWVPYVAAGVVARDPEGGKSLDDSNGGTSFSGSAEIASGYPENPDNAATPCAPSGGGDLCGLYPSAYYYYYDGGTPGFAGTDVDTNGVDDDIQDDILYLRIRVNDSPQSASGLGFQQNHWNFLFDTEETGVPPASDFCTGVDVTPGTENPDCYKEIWIDLDGNGFTGGSSADKLSIIYENLQQDTVSNSDGAGIAGDDCQFKFSGATDDGTGTVVNSFMACHSNGLTGDCEDGSGDDLSHTRTVATNSLTGVDAVTDINGTNGGASDITGEYFVDVQVPVSAMTANNGCYSNPSSLSDAEVIDPGTHIIFKDEQKFRLFYSTANSATDPLQKDFIAPGYFGDVQSTPVTIAHAYVKTQGNSLRFDWSTATETSNIGFNLYAIIGGEWLQLNDDMIAGSLDSLEPRDYQTIVANPYRGSLEQVGIAGVDVQGNEDRHGPFNLNEEFGARPFASPVNWGRVNKDVKASLKQRKVKKGEAVHIDVPENGVYRITGAQLSALGYPLERAKGDHIAISFRGQPIARTIGGLDKKGRWTSASWVEFEAVAPTGRDAVYLNANTYQLSTEVALVEEAGPVETAALAQVVIEQNRQYAFTTPAEDPWYDAAFYAIGSGRPGSLNRTFDVEGYAGGDAELELHVAALSAGGHHLQVSVNGYSLADVSANGWTNWPVSIAVGDGILQESGNTLTLSLPGDASAFDYVLYDKLVVRFEADNHSNAMTPALRLAEAVKRNELANGRADLLVISHPALMGDVLDGYVEQRESEGWRVKLVDVLDLYESYGYGMALPGAIESYLDDASKTGYTHVQLVGSASYDYRDFLGLGSIAFIPSIYAYTADIINYTPCDACYVLGENELPQAAIGRWAVRSQEELANVINKGNTWANNGAANRALLIADAQQPGYNFIGQLESVANQLAQTGQWQEPAREYLDSYLNDYPTDGREAIIQARAGVKAELEAGAKMTFFSGHGAPSTWSYKGMLAQSHIAGIANQANPTLALPFTCYTTYAESPYTSTLAHQLTTGANGAAAVYGAATLSDFSDNWSATRYLLTELLAGKTLGEAVRDSKQNLGADYRDVVLNSNLLGDVTLRLP